MLLASNRECTENSDSNKALTSRGADNFILTANLRNYLSYYRLKNAPIHFDRLLVQRLVFSLLLTFFHISSALFYINVVECLGGC